MKLIDRFSHQEGSFVDIILRYKTKGGALQGDTSWASERITNHDAYPEEQGCPTQSVRRKCDRPKKPVCQTYSSKFKLLTPARTIEKIMGTT